MSFHAGQTFTFGEQPSATKWQYLWDNDYALADGTGISDDAILARHIAAGVVGNSELAAGVLVQEAGNVTTDIATGTTTIPPDNTIPQNTEGDQYMSQAITPKSATNILVIEALIVGSSSISANVAAAIFQDSTSNALAAADLWRQTATGMANLRVVHRMVAGTTSSTTFKVRAGAHSANTFSFNGNAGIRRFGAISKSALFIREFKA